MKRIRAELQVTVNDNDYNWRMTGAAMDEYRHLTGKSFFAFDAAAQADDILVRTLLYVGIKAEHPAVTYEQIVGANVEFGDLAAFLGQFGQLMNNMRDANQGNAASGNGKAPSTPI